MVDFTRYFLCHPAECFNGHYGAGSFDACRIHKGSVFKSTFPHKRVDTLFSVGMVLGARRSGQGLRNQPP